jgi:rod shape-determining protein MreB
LLALDLGSNFVHLAIPEHGLVVREPALVAYDGPGRRAAAVGKEARRLWERQVLDLQIVSPVRSGQVADFDATVALLRPLVTRALGRRPWLHPHVVASCPAEMTPVQARALHDSIHNAGGGQITTVFKPLAAALGAGLTAHDEESVLVVDIGGGSTDVGLVSAGLLTHNRTVPFGGQNLDEALIRAVRRETGLLLDRLTAENIKEQVGAVSGANGAGTYSVRAREEDSPEAGAPQDLDISQVPEILGEAFEPLLEELKWAVDSLPQAVQQDLAAGGVLLTGGGALLRGVEELVREALQLPVGVATDPASCTILGLEAIIRDLPALGLAGRRFGLAAAELAR